MSTNEADVQKAARHKTLLMDGAMFVALGRAGGRLTYTKAEYDEILARYGGSGATIHIEVLRAEGQPEEIQLTLVNKPPANADLVS